MNPLFSLNDVSFHYNSRSVLSGINWELPEGEHYTILGPNGAGKTTLLRLLNLLLRPGGGTLRFRGIDISRAANIDLRNFRQEMAFVFQSPVLFKGTVKQNIEYGLSLRNCPPAEKNQRGEAIIEQAGLSLLTQKKATELSGGEAQRVAVARALVLEPQILLLDEPTTNLDRENQRLIEDLLEAYTQRKDTTLLLVTHSLRQAQKLTQRAVILEQGVLRWQGSIEAMELKTENFW